MALSQLIYISRASSIMTETEIVELVTASEARNARQNITGVLLFSAGNFLQLLEGELSAISTLFERIRLDWRHCDVLSLLVKNVDRRLCPRWGMTLLNVDKAARLDRDRMLKMVSEIRESRDTATTTIEARLLLADFKQQLPDEEVQYRAA